MPSKLQRLFVKAPLSAGAELTLEAPQAHYLLNVLRMKGGDKLLVFNGEEGEWEAELKPARRKGGGLLLTHRTRPQNDGPDLHYLFAPLKRTRLDYMAQKATELGASVLLPVITRRTVAERVNTGRLLANAVEAAEQCGLLRVPEVRPPAKLAQVLSEWRPGPPTRGAPRARSRSWSGRKGGSTPKSGNACLPTTSCVPSPSVPA
jgi:16S rRNA (uracil1498-N3)-methyltransferase